ncbi:MAG: putative 4-hydroxybenzoate polyprenyltransferase [Candidatus Gastranaerophilales bacterium]|nr:putative 4-hydroxybenzoate polyprenyltransferase [Candidatus Gastranaerophilales bacterium]
MISTVKKSKPGIIEYIESKFKIKEYLKSNLKIKEYLESHPKIKKYLESNPIIKEYLESKLGIKEYLKTKLKINEFLESHPKIKELLESNPGLKEYLESIPRIKKLMESKHKLEECLESKPTIKEYLELVKFEHTVFALPFVLSGMLLPDFRFWPNIATIIWVIIAMISGRTGAMALNRLIDADIDKKNPRTANRAIPAGRIKKFNALILAVFSFIILIFATWQLPLICRQLLPVAIIILVLYSYTKRFTNLSHLVLGLALGAAASGGWLAVTGKIDIPVVLWGLAVIFWVAGFDIIYAIQDIDFDRKNHLFSIPAKLGIKKSLLISKLFHLVTVISLIIISIIYPYNIYYHEGVIFVACMLIYEHSLISEKDLSKINTAFFNVNGYISIGFFLFILLDKIFR